MSDYGSAYGDGSYSVRETKESKKDKKDALDQYGIDVSNFGGRKKRRKSRKKKRKSRRRKSRRRKSRRRRGGKRLATSPAEFAKGLTETRPLCAFGTGACKKDRGITDAFQTNKIADILLRLQVEKPNMGKEKNVSSDADSLNSQRASLISKVRSEAPGYIQKYCGMACNAKCIGIRGLPNSLNVLNINSRKTHQSKSFK